MRISDWSSDVCSSDLRLFWRFGLRRRQFAIIGFIQGDAIFCDFHKEDPAMSEAVVHFVERMDDEIDRRPQRLRSEEHTSELQSLMRISYAVFCLKKKTVLQ